MDKVYTAAEMREMADNLIAFPVVQEMLRQAADALEREVAELRERLRVSSNAMEMVVQWLGKYPKWQECLRDCVAKNRKAAGEAADALEREKKYEYAVEYYDNVKWEVYKNELTLVEALKLSSEPWRSPHRIVRREVGEWEEVKDGE